MIVVRENVSRPTRSIWQSALPGVVINILYFLFFSIVVAFAAPHLLRAQGLMPPGAAAAPIQSIAHQHAAIISILGPIDQITFTSVQRRIAEARKLGATIIIYHIDSRGGLLGPALQISQLTRSLDMPTVAYIDGSAIGPALMIAVSCRQIVMSPDAAIGDGEQFELTGDLADQAARQPKIQNQSPVLSDLQASAAVCGYPLLVLLAMVDRQVIIDEFQNSLTGRTLYVAPDDEQNLLNIQQTAPGQPPVHPWVYVNRIKASGTLLTAQTSQGMDLRLCQAKADSVDQLPALLNIVGPQIDVLDENALEITARWLSSPDIRFLLFVLMIVFGYMELSHPGTMFFGLLALVALALLLCGPLLAGATDWWEILPIALGIILIVFDMIHFGGLGILAVPGVLLIIIGLLATFLPFGELPSDSAAFFSALQSGLMVVILGVATGTLIIALLIRYLRMTPGINRLMLAAVPATSLAESPSVQEVFVGAVGRAVTDLRPAGKAQFDECLTDVVSDSGFVPNGAPVQVLQISEHQVLVRPLSDADNAHNITGTTVQ
jgi:membrane-bound serine protease (ClpP class)